VQQEVIVTSIDRIIRRLEEAVREETEALRADPAADLGDFSKRKGHGLLELIRAAQALPGRAMDAETVRQFESLRAQLEINRAALELHLQAVREIAGVISNAIRAADSDGTYTPVVCGEPARS
jgi:hypothetical protein